MKDIKVLRKELTNLVGSTAWHRGPVENKSSREIRAKLPIPKPPTHDKGSAFGGGLR